MKSWDSSTSFSIVIPKNMILHYNTTPKDSINVI